MQILSGVSQHLLCITLFVFVDSEWSITNGVQEMFWRWDLLSVVG